MQGNEVSTKGNQCLSSHVLREFVVVICRVMSLYFMIIDFVPQDLCAIAGLVTEKFVQTSF